MALRKRLLANYSKLYNHPSLKIWTLASKHISCIYLLQYWINLKWIFLSISLAFPSWRLDIRDDKDKIVVFNLFGLAWWNAAYWRISLKVIVPSKWLVFYGNSAFRLGKSNVLWKNIGLVFINRTACACLSSPPGNCNKETSSQLEFFVRTSWEPAWHHDEN